MVEIPMVEIPMFEIPMWTLPLARYYLAVLESGKRDLRTVRCNMRLVIKYFRVHTKLYQGLQTLFIFPIAKIL